MWVSACLNERQRSAYLILSTFVFETAVQLFLLSPFQNLGKPVQSSKNKVAAMLSFCSPSRCCFHCLFSPSQTVFQLIPIIPDREFRGVAGPTSRSKPGAELDPTGSQVELLLLHVWVRAPQPESKSILLTFRRKNTTTTCRCLTFFHKKRKPSGRGLPPSATVNL